MKSLENDNYMTLVFTTMRRFDQPGADKKFVSPMQKGDANLSYVRRVDNWHPEIGRSVDPRSNRPAVGPQICHLRPRKPHGHT